MKESENHYGQCDFSDMGKVLLLWLYLLRSQLRFLEKTAGRSNDLMSEISFLMKLYISNGTWNSQCE